jgi:hypothetical protein
MLRPFSIMAIQADFPAKGATLCGIIENALLRSAPGAAPNF